MKHFVLSWRGLFRAMVVVALLAVVAHAARFPVAGSMPRVDSVKTNQPPQSPRKITSNPTLASPGPVGEVTTKRSLTSKVFYHGNGRYSALLATYPLHYRDQSGNWTPIDTTIVALSGRDGFACETNMPKFYFPASSPSVSIKMPEGVTIPFQPRGVGILGKDGTILKEITPKVASAALSNDGLTYVGNYKGIAEKFKVGPGQLGHEMILERPLDWMRELANEGSTSFAAYECQLPYGFTLWSEGRAVKEGEFVTRNPLVIQNATGEVMFVLYPPAALESSPGRSLVYGTYRGKVNGSKVTLFEEITLSWLLDARRQWPIRILSYKFYKLLTPGTFGGVARKYGMNDYQTWFFEAGIDNQPYTPWSIIRGYVEWDHLSWSIASAATIDSLRFKANFIVHKIPVTPDTFYVNYLDLKPSSSGSLLPDLWSHIGSGTTYADTFVTGMGDFTIRLGSTANGDFTSSLQGVDWFALGIARENEVPDPAESRYVSFGSPALEVFYTVEDLTPPTITMNFNPGKVQACDARLVPVLAQESGADWVTKISLYLSTDDGVSWEKQTDTINTQYKNPFPGDNQENSKVKWNVPGTPAPWCRLKAVAFDRVGNAAEITTQYSFRIEAPFDPSPWGFVNNGLINPDINDISVCRDHPKVVYAAGPVSRSRDYGNTWVRLPFPSGGGGTWGDPYAVAAHPSDSNTVYIGLQGNLADNEGVWKSTDGGQNWAAPPPFNSERHGIMDIVFAPSDLSVMYAVGYEYGYTWISPEFFKSTDWGQHWMRKIIGLPGNTSVFCVAVDPRSTNTVYIGVFPGSDAVLWAAGVWKSTDGGDHWTHVLGSPGNNQYPSIASICIDPNNPDVVYAAVGWDSHQTPIYGVFKTTDAGVHWTSISGSAISTFVSSMALDPSNPNKIYLGTWYSEPRRVYFSSNGGGSWVNTTGCDELPNDANVVTPSPVYNNPDPNKPCLLYSGLDVAGVYRYLPEALQVPPPAPTGLVAQAVSESSIELRWNYDPAFKTGYAIFRSTVSGMYGNPVALLPAYATFWTDNGLNRGRRYYYVVKAVRLNQISSASNEASSQTFWLNTPINLDATALSHNEIYLRFGDMSRYEDSYSIQRRLFNQGNFVPVGQATSQYPTGWVYYTDANNLSPSTKYEYRVWAFDDLGHQSNFSNIDTVTTRGYVSSTHDSATAYNNGRKMVRDDAGRLHLVYSDGGYINYTYSNDNGYTWSPPEYWMEAMRTPNTFAPAIAVGRGSNPWVYIAYIGWWKTPVLPCLIVVARNPGEPNGDRWQQLFVDNRGVISGYKKIWGPPALVIDSQNWPHAVWKYWTDDTAHISEVCLWHWWLAANGAHLQRVHYDRPNDGLNPSLARDEGGELGDLWMVYESTGSSPQVVPSFNTSPYTTWWYDDWQNLWGVHSSIFSDGRLMQFVWERGNPNKIYSATYHRDCLIWDPVMVPVSDISAPNTYPSIVNNYCTWADNISNNWEIYYSQKVGNEWSPRRNISQSPTVSSKYPHAVFYQQGRPIYNRYLGVVWTEGTSLPDHFQVKYQSIRLPWDVAWSTSEAGTGYNNAKRFLADGQGTLHLAYTSKDSVFFISSTDGGDSWSEPKSLGQGDSPALNLDESGNPCVTWRVMDVQAQRLHVYFARRVQNAWQVFEAYNGPMPGIAYITPFSVAVGQGDTTHVCFEYIDLGLVEPWKIFYGNFMVSSPQMAFLTVLDSLAVGPDSLPVSPSLCLDGRGMVHCVWSDPGGEVQYRKRVQGVFSPKVNLSNSPGVASIHPTISAFGPVAVAWQEEVSPGASDIFYRTIGDSLFSPIQNMSNTPLASSESPIISGAGVLWSEAVDGDYEVYQTKFDSETMTWTAPGSASATDANSKHPQVALFQKEQSAWAYTVWTEEIIPNQAYQILFTGQELPAQPAYALDLGQSQPSPFVVQRDGFIQYGPEPARTVDYDTTELVYHLTNLNSYKRDKLVLSFYQESGQDWKLKLWADQISLGMVHVPPGQEVVLDRWLPPNVYADGEVTLRIKRERGDFAVLGKLLIYEYAHGGGGGGPQAAEGAFPIPLPTVFALGQNYPNPFKDHSTIRYQLPVETPVSLKVYNVTGQVVKELVQGKQKPGYYTAVWDGKDAHGRGVASGIYFYRLEAGEFRKIKKLVVVR